MENEERSTRIIESILVLQGELIALKLLHVGVLAALPQLQSRALAMAQGLEEASAPELHPISRSTAVQTLHSLQGLAAVQQSNRAESAAEVDELLERMRRPLPPAKPAVG